jgi:hypothetical protein
VNGHNVKAVAKAKPRSAPQELELAPPHLYRRVDKIVEALDALGRTIQDTNEAAIAKATAPPSVINVQLPDTLHFTPVPTETVAERDEHGLVARSVTRPLVQE